MSYFFSQLSHLYIHWPFCPYKCHFCDFVAMASHEEFMQQYHQALLAEIHRFIPFNQQKSLIKTIYFGGGTPSTYPGHLLLDTFGMLTKNFHFAQNIEITIEVNPGTVTTELLHIWKQAGINRLSIGVQSLKDSVLQSLNRHQTHQQVITLLQEASTLFENISVDFILGLPDISDDEWKAMVHEVLQWPIKHISIYFLTVHEDTPLYFKIKTNKIRLPADDAMVALYDWTVETLKNYGFDRYELSNFAKPGYESLHNQAYWNRSEYKGFGLGACSFNGTSRFQNVKNLGKYLQGMDGQSSIIEMSEDLNSQQVALEKIMLGLRQRSGLQIYDFSKNMPEEQKTKFFKEVEYLVSVDMVSKHNDRIVLTPRGYALENEVTLRLFS